MLIKRLAAFAVAVMVALPGAFAFAAPKAELWQRWERHNADSETKVDHSAWDGFLKKHLTPKDGINRLDYAAVGAEDKKILAGYLRLLEQTRVSSLNRGEQRAFWINFYNALTADVVLRHYPVESILDIDISPGLLARGPWGKKLAEVEGEEVSLDDIEHRILRPIWKDARIHYAVNCASIGCPNLMTEAFTSDNTERLLERGARDFINHPRGAMVADGKLTVSSIYEWFVDDFGGDDTGVIKHLREYADDDLLKSLAEVNSVDDDKYDWQLNKP